MKKQHLVMSLILGGCVAAVACSSSDDSSSGGGGTGGSSAGTTAGGNAGTANAGAHAGGSSGAATGGAAAGGSGGTAGSGVAGTSAGATAEGGADTGAAGEGGAPTVVVPPPPPPQPLDPETLVVTSATPSSFNHVLVTGTDYATQGEVASVKLNPATIEDSTVYPDPKGDVITVGSGGLGFALQRSLDKVTMLNGSKVQTTFDITSAGTGTAANIAHKAYVPVYNKNFISILDLSAGTVSGRIDLSQFNDPNDSDGSVNTTVAMYDPGQKIAYFVLSRIDLNSFDSNFNLPCSATKSLVVGVDATTDTIVDLNGSADGKALELYLADPASATLSSDGKTITVFDYGCFAGSLTKQGVELVHLDTASRTIAYAPTDDNIPDDLILLTGQQALLHTSAPDYSADYWNKLDLSTGILGAQLNNVPLSPVFDGNDVVGVTIDATSQAATVVKYNVSNDTTSLVIASPWAGKYSSAAGTSLVQ